MVFKILLFPTHPSNTCIFTKLVLYSLAYFIIHVIPSEFFFTVRTLADIKRTQLNLFIKPFEVELTGAQIVCFFLRPRLQQHVHSLDCLLKEDVVEACPLRSPFTFAFTFFFLLALPLVSFHLQGIFSRHPFGISRARIF